MARRCLPILPLLLIIGLLFVPALVQAQEACVITPGTVNDLTADCTIAGPITIPAGPATVINGGGHALSAATARPLFTVEVGATLRLENLVLMNSRPAPGDTIFNVIGGELVLANSLISENTAADGSVIFNLIGGTMTITNSVIRDHATSGDGVIFNLIGSTLSVSNSIVDGLTAPDGSAMFNTVGSTLVVNGSPAAAPPEPAVEIVPVAPEPAPDRVAANCTITTDYRVNLRAEPAAESDILGVIPYQTTLAVTAAQQEDWYAVEWEGQSGWVMAEYVTEICE